jgi:hypothetical protein
MVRAQRYAAEAPVAPELEPDPVARRMCAHHGVHVADRLHPATVDPYDHVTLVELAVGGRTGHDQDYLGPFSGRTLVAQGLQRDLLGGALRLDHLNLLLLLELF